MDGLKNILLQVMQLLNRPLLESGPPQATYGALVMVVGAFAIWFKLEQRLRSRYLLPLLGHSNIKPEWKSVISGVVRILLLLVGADVLLGVSSLDYYAFQIGAHVAPLWGTPIIHAGKASLSLDSICYLVIWWTALLVLTGKAQNWIVTHFFFASRINIGTREAIGTILRYTIIGFGTVIILQTAGVDLSALTVVAGALGLGVSFGLQTITTNFVSGIIVLLERPIKVGDRIDVGTINGDVIKISLRATTVRTNDNIEIIIPNSEFINNRVINWSYSSKTIRFNVPIGTSYDSDPKEVRKILLEVAAAHPGVLKEPQTDVVFLGFGDNSLNFDLRIWTDTFSTQPKTIMSDIYFEIFDRFKAAGIDVPFPQRDLHIKSPITVAFSGKNGNSNHAPDPSTATQVDSSPAKADG